MSKLQLNPCCWCGRTDAVIDEVELLDLNTGIEVIWYAVVCPCCCMCTWNYSTKERAVKAWNECEDM